MKKLKINQKNLELLLDNLRKEDENELIASFGKNYKKIFVKTVLKHKKSSIFLSDENAFPLAIGGIIKTNKNYSTPWLISSKEFKNHQKEILKYVFHKLNEYIEENNILFNYIYKSNFKALKWLKKFGFKTIDMNENYKIFYYIKGENIDIRHITRK